jgi:hypothetical protein
MGKGKQIRLKAAQDPNDPLHEAMRVAEGRYSQLATVNPDHRPTLYTPEIIDKICYQLDQGLPLMEICRLNPDLPSYTTIFSWMREKDRPAGVPVEVAERIANARDAGMDMIANRTLLTASGVPGYSTGDIHRDKLVVDTLFKLMSKWSHRYSDSMTIRGDKDNPITLSVSQALEQAIEHKKRLQKETKILDAEFKDA